MNRVAFRKFLRASCVLAAFAAPAAAAAQAPVPDFSAGDSSWSGAGSGDFNAVPGSSLAPPIMQDPAHPRVSNGDDGQPNYRIGDLAYPNLQPWAKEIMRRDNDEVLAGKIGFTPRSSCMPGGVPEFELMGGSNLHFLQTPDMVLMIQDGDAQMRRVYLGVPHSENPRTDWYGESIGHYEGDTLVVDTIAVDTRAFIDGYRTPHTDQLHVVERFRLLDPDHFELKVVVEDPGAFNQPWEGMRVYSRGEGRLTEEVCAEGISPVIDYGIPVDRSPDF